MKGFTEVLPLILCISIAVAAVYTYGVAVGVSEAVVKNIIIEKDIYLLGNMLSYSKIFLDTSLKYSTYQSVFDVGDFNSTLPSKESFQNQVSEKIKSNLNAYTQQKVIFFDDDHQIDLPKYNKVDVLLENNTVKVHAGGDKIQISQHTPTEKIDLAKDSTLDLELEYNLFEEAAKFMSEKALEKKLKELIASFPLSGESKLVGCENKAREIDDFDVLNSVQGSNYLSINEAQNSVLVHLIDEAGALISSQSTNKTKWEFFITGNSTKLTSSCQVKREDKCDNNQTKSYTYTKTCTFDYSYQINTSIQLTDMVNKYSVESGLLLNKKINMENLKLKFNQFLDLKSNSVG